MFEDQQRSVTGSISERKRLKQFQHFVFLPGTGQVNRKNPVFDDLPLCRTILRVLPDDPPPFKGAIVRNEFPCMVHEFMHGQPDPGPVRKARAVAGIVDPHRNRRKSPADAVHQGTERLPRPD